MRFRQFFDKWKLTDEVRLLYGLGKECRESIARLAWIAATVGTNSDNWRIGILAVRAPDVLGSTLAIH